MSQAWPPSPVSVPIRTLLRLALGLLALLVLGLPGAAFAQVANQYTVTGTDPINDLTCGTGSVVTKTFTVGNNVRITDVNIGIAIALDESKGGGLVVAVGVGGERAEDHVGSPRREDGAQGHTNSVRWAGFGTAIKACAYAIRPPSARGAAMVVWNHFGTMSAVFLPPIGGGTRPLHR